jgi:hypothetical protein
MSIMPGEPVQIAAGTHTDTITAAATTAPVLREGGL